MDEVGAVIAEGLGYRLSPGPLAHFCACARKASRIVYLADNAGEIVFDRLLIEQILKCSRAEIIVAVRGSPVLNDATLSDARAVGMESVASVISSGSDAPGTILARCSDRLRACYASADMVIAKGQGNFESLCERGENIFFLLKVKCGVIAALTGHAVGEPVILSRSGPASGP